MSLLLLSDMSELDGIVRNTVESIQSNEYSINEALFEVIPYEYSLNADELAYVRNQVRKECE